jgi:spermidine synthase
MGPILITAFLEGLTVLVIEIAGTRAIAPFFGTSLYVWTATITATLLFLALGYGLGGALCKRGPMALPMVFWVAGGWLALYPFWRTLLLNSLTGLGIPVGAFVACAWLFGPPLTCLGAVSPLLIHRLAKDGIDGGQAAGWLFFTNTIGGLGGGWLTALVLIPLAPMRLVLAGAGTLLVAIGAYWARKERREAPALLLLLACATWIGLAPKPSSIVRSKEPGGPELRVVHRAQSASGLVQVLELPGIERHMLIDGVLQGGIDLASGASSYPMSEYMSFVAHRVHPNAKRALLLGLGCGVLAKTMHGMGLDVTAVEIEPEVAEASRKFFLLPDDVQIAVEDARTFLAHDSAHYDVVVLDAFAGEASPWYLLTREGLQAIKARLAPGGRMVVNTVTRADGESEGLKRLESSLLEVFGEGLVFIEPALPTEADKLVNVTVAAGANLTLHDVPYPAKPSRGVAPFIGDLRALEPNPLRAGARIDVDEHSSLDRVEAKARLRWRKGIIEALGPEVLQD